MEKQINIAVVGATGLVGSAVLEHLSESKISVGQLYPLASGQTESESVAFGKKYLSVHSLSDFDFSKADLCFFCVPAKVTDEYIERAVKAGCYCIDFSAASRLKQDVPLIVSDVNAEALRDLEGKVIACPDSSVTHLAQIIAPLTKLAVVERVNVVLMRAVSEYGRKAIDELSEQSIALFNLKPIRTKHFAKQIAFNVLPHACHISGSGSESGMAGEIEQELRKVIGDDALSVNSTLVQVPVFFGHSMAIQLEFGAEVPIQKIEDLINVAVDLHLVDQELNSPTVVSDAVNQAGVYIGAIRKDPTWPQGINLWAVADNVHQGAAINGVQLAEILVKDYL
ncbi:MAG: aspartate-semialdehyde dehydrogenase [Thioalkalispiraceae bacterium]|jgi:aspartate-semialdehyde dehydrogenase